MDHPKTFYRKLDALLAKISKDSKNKNFLRSIFQELKENFCYELNIVDGAIYEHRDKYLKLVYSSESTRWSPTLEQESGPVRHVLEHGSFIFTDFEQGRYFGLQQPPDYLIPAAITINSPERQWLLVFALKSGWIYEEITLFLNAVKTALNYRLFSEIIGGELEQAVQIQKSLLPRRSPSFNGYDICGRSIPAELVGGDFYEYFEYDEGSFGISIGDASGHGLPAALLVRDVVIGLRMGLTSEYKTVHILKKVNRVIQQSTYSSNFVSLFMGELEKNGHLFYVNAGHPPPFLVFGDEIEELGPTGIVLGYLKEIDLQRSYVHLKQESVLVLYSDGIVERKNAEDQEFGRERLKQLVVENRDLGAEELVERVFTEVFHYGGSTNWDDDATLVIIKRI